MGAKISGIERGSLAEKAGLHVGDTIKTINGIEIADYLDFMFSSCQEEVEIELEDRTVRIENEDYLPLGIQFPTLLIDKPRACHNRCVFCFIDQLPKDMRESCYFKDDDYRLSFLQGNYVSMTNMQDEDVERILRYNIPRINVSVHTTNPELRVRMLHNRRAGEVLSYLQRFVDGGLNLNAQIVLCPDWNDGNELDRTISDLGKLGESLESVSVVPVGLSKYRETLEPLRGFDKESAAAVIKQVNKWQGQFLESRGSRLVYLADEFYIMAGVSLPAAEEYEGFPQIENGVGLCSSFADEFYEAWKDSKKRKPKKKKTVVTGQISYGFLQSLVEKLEGEKIKVLPITNHFFGEKITVTGLITGRDLIEQLKGKELGEKLLLSSSMLRHGDTVFLDDVTVSDVETALKVRTIVVPNDGYAFFDALIDR